MRPPAVLGSALCWAAAAAYSAPERLAAAAADAPTALFEGNFQIMTQTLSELTRARARSAADSASPELDALLREIDEKMKPLNRSLLSRERCSEMAEALSAGTAKHLFSSRSKWSPPCLLVHTGLVQGPSDWADGGRKLRLGLLSFLATQDLHCAELHFWAGFSPDNAVLREALRPILSDERYAGHVKVRQFDAGREFGAALPGNPTAAQLLETLYNGETMMASKSDLQRVVLLNNYGGLWIDTDVLLVSDLTAVANQDWAYLGEDGFINNAALSVSKPRSAFIKAYLATIAARSIQSAADTNIFKYGPTMLFGLLQKQQYWGTFHVLPACFFDGGWWEVPGSTGWDDFFSSNATEAEVAYIAPDPWRRHQTLGYHWHGRWKEPVVPGCLADRAEKIYLKSLALPG